VYVVGLGAFLVQHNLVSLNTRWTLNPLRELMLKNATHNSTHALCNHLSLAVNETLKNGL